MKNGFLIHIIRLCKAKMASYTNNVTSAVFPSKMVTKGVYVFYNLSIRDPLPPYGLLFKIGGGMIRDRFKNAQETEGTYLPYPYEILNAKTIGDDWGYYESILHKKFAAYSITYKIGSGLGTEWFRNLTTEMIMKEMENIPGEWYQQPFDHDEFDKKSNTDQYTWICSQNKKLNLQTKHDYESSAQDREVFIPNPNRYFAKDWTTWYDFLGIDTTSFPQTKTDWKNQCKKLDILNIDDYKSKNDGSLPNDPFMLYSEFMGIDSELGHVVDDVM